MSIERMVPIERTIERCRERHEDPPFWYPWPLFLSFGLVLVIAGFVLKTINPKHGYSGSLITLEAENSKSGSIWFALTLRGDDLIVMTEERTTLTFPRKFDSADDLRPLTEYLRKKVDQRIEKLGLARRGTINDALVVIAADERLRFAHVRPVLQALAEARITNYAFETMKPLKESHEPTLSQNGSIR